MIVNLFDIGAITKETNFCIERIIIKWLQCPKFVYHVAKIKELSFVHHNLVIVACASVVSEADERVR